MKFIERVQKQFENAGFSESNDSLKEYKEVYRFDEFPSFLKTFYQNVDLSWF